MLKMRKVAVTGGLSAGKTTVCQFFKTLGAYVVSADEITHHLLSPGSSIGLQVVDLLGPSILTTENKFDRRRIATIVFSNSKKLAALESLLHPSVFNEIDVIYERIKQSKNYSLFLAEVPLLYEAEQEKRFDAVITVFADESLSRQRFLNRTFSNPDEFTMRMNRQMSPHLKANKSNYILYNNGNLDQLKAGVLDLYSQLTQTPQSSQTE